MKPVVWIGKSVSYAPWSPLPGLWSIMIVALPSL
ncbi:hypothetical protein PDIG_42660 [Penicillium digitatum PHI26]|uniref:Uncharacterized protein n=2 Tax=Penicillium digitatum TaxID=36651 RepID=K9FSM6_PEND2|nr:hypothetical protein PDIP_41240 [Penicillium digitatum Pd1]EKV12665.1 hypothetical protein PDIG_42660 [Penicillium digitatum PHI26]EKV15065.1 hypothetical protein PDIP_41240 [Penicillium digitatum Pd1]